MDITEMDSLCDRIVKTKAEIEALKEQIEVKEAAISEVKNRVQEYFIETKREAPYQSPFGTLYLRSDLQIKQPKGDSLRALFEHFVKNFGEEVAWQKMSIHNAILKAEMKDHIAAVEARGGDPILEPLPGVESPTTYKSLQFRKK